MKDEIYIERCLQLAQKGKGFVAPNPLVGAVLVYDGKIIGEGWHERYGENHAEVNCINAIKNEDKHLIPESMMYINLEPCAHQGKTPSCAKKLVNEKIKRVIVCNDDPFEKVSGRGFAILKENNIDYKSGILSKKGLWVNRRFFCFHQHKRPYIILKWAQTQQGFFAPQDGSRLQISNKHSKQLVHKWRTEEAAILVGTNTAMNDDPQLTARLWRGKQPLRIVIDRTLKLVNTLNVFNNETETWIINEVKENNEGNVKYVKLDFDENILEQILQRLHDANILSLIVEGGATLLNSFIKKELWDEARIFITPNLLNDGIIAPQIKNANHVMSATIETDELNVFIHKQSQYQYSEGMEL